MNLLGNTPLYDCLYFIGKLSGVSNDVLENFPRKHIRVCLSV